MPFDNTLEPLIYDLKIPVFTHIFHHRFPFVTLSEDKKVFRVHYNYRRSIRTDKEPGLDIVFFIYLETMEIKYFDFKGSLNVLYDQGDQLLKYHYFFLSDFSSF